MKNTTVVAVNQMVQILGHMKEGKNAEETKVLMAMNKNQYFSRLRSMRLLGVNWVVSNSKYNLVSSGIFK